MRRNSQHTTRKAAVSLFAAAALALTGCGGGGEEDTGTEVDDITGGDVAETTAPAETTGPAETTAPTEGEGTAVPGAPFSGPYNRQFSDDQEVHEGQEVTLTAEVESVVSGNAFTIGDPDDLTLDPLLVVHDVDLPDLAEDQALEVVGTVMTDFDVVTAEEELGVDLEDALYEDHQGDPWLHATDATVTEEG